MPGFQPLKRVQVAIGIVVRDGMILICRRRSNDSFGGFWEFPGGKCEPDEAPDQAVRRELLEELNIAVTPVRELVPVEHCYPQAIVILHPFVCRFDSGEPQAISASEFRWVRPVELADFRFPPANAGFLETLMTLGFVDGAIDLPAGGA